MNTPPLRALPFLLLLITLLSAQLACGVAGAPPAPAATPPPANPNQRMLILEYPATIRAGDVDRVILTLEMDEQGSLVPTAQAGGNIIQGEIIEIPNIYDTHNLMAEARLDLAGAQAQPAETVSETLLPGQKVVFFWSIRPRQAGSYKGTVWFYLRFIPKDGSPDSRRALSAQMIEIEAVTLLGLKAGPARWLGMFGAFIGAALAFPLIEDALKWAVSRPRKRR